MDIMEMIGAQPMGPLTPEQEALRRAQVEHAIAMKEREQFLEQAERQIILKYAWLYCTCRPRFTWNESVADPSWANCIVHGRFMVTASGEVIG